MQKTKPSLRTLWVCCGSSASRKSRKPRSASSRWASKSGAGSVMGTPEVSHVTTGPASVVGPGLRSTMAQVLPTEQHQDAVRTVTGCAASAGNRRRGIRRSEALQPATLAATSPQPGADPDPGGDSAGPPLKPGWLARESRSADTDHAQTAHIGERATVAGSGAVRPPLDASQSATQCTTRTRVRILPRPPGIASPKGPSCSAEAWSGSADLSLGRGGYCRLSPLSPERTCTDPRGHARKMCAVPLDAYPHNIRRLTRPPTYRHSMCGGSGDGGLATPV
jgi:hypothetical protein